MSRNKSRLVMHEPSADAVAVAPAVPESLGSRRSKAKLMPYLAGAVMVGGSVAAGLLGPGTFPGLLLLVASFALAVVLMSQTTSIALATGDDLARAMAAADAFDLAATTATYRERHGLSAEVAAWHEREFRRWAALAAMAKAPATSWPSPPGPLPAYREVLAAQPELFKAFCTSLETGHQALAFQPAPYAEAGFAYAHLWLAYGFAHGAAPDPALWPPVTYSLLATRQAEIATVGANDPLSAAARAMNWPGATDNNG